MHTAMCLVTFEGGDIIMGGVYAGSIQPIKYKTSDMQRNISVPSAAIST